jgi:23S rRNA (cytosine1962-C5)-methyltransferase
MKKQPLHLPLILDGEDKSSPIKNRIRKNYQHMRKWAKRSETDCFRIYDRDIKEYPLAVDFYAGRFCVHFFSYDGDELSVELKEEVSQILRSLFGVSESSIYWRLRARRDKKEQAKKMSENGSFFYVREYGVKFKVNLSDYLDTGLFLDHRETRRMVASIARDRRLLNLFAYTCSFSVHAALAGACFTKSVDISNTYTEWGRDNFLLNSIPLKNHEIIREDCLKFLSYERGEYDIIVIDPPTISRSKKMEQIFDIQIDYPFLIQKALQLLAAGGVIFFSTNSRQFKFDVTLFSGCSVQNITDKTIPLDFNKKIHQCWKIKILD